jgi:RsiW-degrading membrane proteinase PrsW (M82 family)
MELPPEAQTIKDLNNVAGIIALIFAIIFFVIGVVTLIILIGIIFIVFGVINLIIRSNIREINNFIDNKEYSKAKEKQLLWVVIGFILGGLIIGIILLIAYLKYDDLLRKEKTV